MDMREYQRRALETDQMPGDASTALIVPLLGLAGEAGTLLSEYKKFLRDGEAHRLHQERVAEELGDLLWYLSNVASKYGLELDAIAEANLTKVRGRWTLRGRAAIGAGGAPQFDAAYRESERLPRQFGVDIIELPTGDTLKVQAFVDGVRFGHDLTDNAYDPDGYRFHDAFHFAYAAVLGWSPVTRGFLKRKRKSNPVVDRVEDGGRAIAIEEGVAALVFDYARAHVFLEGVVALDESLLRAIMGVTSHLEVGRCSAGEWEMAVFAGFDVWRELVAHRGGHLTVDLDARSIRFCPKGS